MSPSLGVSAQGIFLLFKKVAVLLKDAIFPIFCVECGLEGEWWCKKCRSGFEYHPMIFYPSADSGIDSALACFLYHELYPTGKLLRYWKYGHARQVEEIWQWILKTNDLHIARWSQMFDKNQPIGLAAVPLHPRRRRERGFNQSEILVDLLKSVLEKNNIKVEIISGLKRTRYTHQQAKLSSEKKSKNLLDAFDYSDATLPKQMILVDDVFTNGYTLGECAKVLRKNGAVKIGGFLLAKG